jgi:hypothetical protein
VAIARNGPLCHSQEPGAPLSSRHARIQSGWDDAAYRSSSGSPSPLRSPDACSPRALRHARIPTAGTQRAPELSRTMCGSSSFKSNILPFRIATSLHSNAHQSRNILCMPKIATSLTTHPTPPRSPRGPSPLVLGVGAVLCTRKRGSGPQDQALSSRLICTRSNAMEDVSMTKRPRTFVPDRSA